MTRQLTRCGTVENEYHKAEDVFHISESDAFFYHLCLADPANGSLHLRARKFAGFYTGDDPAVRNYDPEKRIILSPVNGSGGPSYRDDSQRDSLHRGSERYGIPFYDLPGISSWRDTEDDAKALEMGRAVHDRWKRGGRHPQHRPDHPGDERLSPHRRGEVPRLGGRVRRRLDGARHGPTTG